MFQNSTWQLRLLLVSIPAFFGIGSNALEHRDLGAVRAVQRIFKPDLETCAKSYNSGTCVVTQFSGSDLEQGVEIARNSPRCFIELPAEENARNKSKIVVAIDTYNKGYVVNIRGAKSTPKDSADHLRYIAECFSSLAPDAISVTVLTPANLIP